MNTCFIIKSMSIYLPHIHAYTYMCMYIIQYRIQIASIIITLQPSQTMFLDTADMEQETMRRIEQYSSSEYSIRPQQQAARVRKRPNNNDQYGKNLPMSLKGEGVIYFDEIDGPQNGPDSQMGKYNPNQYVRGGGRIKGVKGEKIGKTSDPTKSGPVEENKLYRTSK